MIDPVGECAVMDTKPSPSRSRTIGDRGGYSIDRSRQKGAANAAKAKCKRVIE